MAARRSSGGVMGHFLGHAGKVLGLEHLGRVQIVFPALFQELLAEQGAPPALLGLDPCLDPRAGLGGLDELEPVPARRVARLGADLDAVAVLELVLERNDLAVHLGADALMADVGMYAVGEVHGRGAQRSSFTSPRE